MPLSDAQKKLASGMIFPSGEANFYDFTQDHSYHKGSGINVKYVRTSGELFQTYQPNSSGIAERSGIFSFNQLIGQFSSSSGQVTPDDFSLYAPYVHYYPDRKKSDNFTKDAAFYIPFVSSFKVSTIYDPYKRIF